MTENIQILELVSITNLFLISFVTRLDNLKKS